MEDLDENLNEIRELNSMIESLLFDLEKGNCNRYFRESKLISKGIREFKTRKGNEFL